MKGLLLFALFICTVNASSADDDLLTDLTILSELKNAFKTQIMEDVNPLSIIHINFNHEAISLNGTLEDVILGLGDFEVCVNYSTNFVFYLNVTISEIKLAGGYDIDGNIGELFPIFGEGPFNMTLFNFTVMTNTTKTLPDLMNIENVELYLESANVNLENFMYDDDDLGPLFNKIFEQILPETLEILWDEFKDKIKKSAGVVFGVDGKWLDFFNELKSGSPGSIKICF